LEDSEFGKRKKRREDKGERKMMMRVVVRR